MPVKESIAERPQLSIVVPCFGCTGTLKPLHQRLTAALGHFVSSYEIIFVDDRGKQDQWPILQEIASQDSNVKTIRLSKNYGQQIAITAGLAESTGDYAVVMDCDLQDPPEFIVEMWNEAQKGKNIVYASRKLGDPVRRRLANRLYFWLMSVTAGYKVDPGLGSFSLISRQVIDAFLRFEEKERHYLFILQWLGFDASTLTYERHSREIGKSSYNFASLLRHSIEGFFFQSTAPLLWILWLGMTGATASFIASILFLVNASLGQPPEGYTSLIIVQLMIGSVLLTCLGAIGLYVSRIFEMSKNRPLYIVEKTPPT